MSQVRAAGRTQVSGAQVEDPVGQAELGEQRLAAGEDVLLAGDGLLGAVGQREELDLVELVDAQSPRVSRPAAPASRRKHEVWAVYRSGRSGFVEHLVAVQRGERHLGGGDRPEVVALHVVRLVLELREVAGGDHRVGADERGRTDLLVGVGVPVEAQLHHGPQQPGAPTSVQREHRAGDLGRPLAVEDPSSAPMSQCGTRWCGRRHRVVALGAEHDVVLLAGAVGAVGRREVRRAQEQLVHLVG